MHELAMATHLVDLVEQHARKANAERVVAVDLVIGAQSHLVADSLRFHFSALTEANGSLARGAELRFRQVPMTLRCPRCEADYTPAGRDLRCPDCGALGTLTERGDEVTLESIEVEP